VKKVKPSVKQFGSRGRIRTYDQAVNPSDAGRTRSTLHPYQNAAEVLGLFSRASNFVLVAWPLPGQ